MKKFALPFAALALLVCLFATSAFANDVTYATASVNLRVGPGTQYAVLCVIPSGAQVYIEQPDVGSGWTMVDFGNYTGYVATKYLMVGQNIETGTNGVPGVAGTYEASAAVNMRSGPGTQYAVVFVVPQGTYVYVDSVTNGWAHANYGNANGYISSEYLIGLGGSNTAATVTSNTGPSGNAGNGAYTITGNVNLRTGPGTEYASMLVIPAGAQVSVSDYANGWAHVNYAGYVGYVSTKYISGLGGANTYVAPSAPNTAKAASGTSWYNGCDYSNVYDYGYYYSYNKDVVNALGGSPEALIQHFVTYGMDEGRQGRASFNVYTFMEQHPELHERFGNNLRLYYLNACGLA